MGIRQTVPDIEWMADEVVECAGGGRGTIYAALRDAYQMGRYGLTYGELQALQQRELADWREANKDEQVLF